MISASFIGIFYLNIRVFIKFIVLFNAPDNMKDSAFSVISSRNSLFLDGLNRNTAPNKCQAGFAAILLALIVWIKNMYSS